MGLTLAYVLARIITERALDLGDGAAAVMVATAVHVGLAGLALFVTSARPIRRDLAAQRALLRASEAEMVERVRQQAFLRDLQDALDMGETEADALAVTAKALRDAAPGPAELLVADASRAHLRRAAAAAGTGAPGCGVETPWGCPAVRRGRTLQFESSDDLSACPRLSDRGGEPCSAVCVPITILGTPTAVIHATAPVVGGRVAARRSRTGSRASRPRSAPGSACCAPWPSHSCRPRPIRSPGCSTGAPWRSGCATCGRPDTPFALAMADLDHFKRLNDSYGHDTGDRALRTFARVLREAVRDNDVVARHGGEEFVVVLPGVDAVTAAPVLHRIRERLQEAVGTALIPQFSVSIGLADSSWSSDLTDVLRAADHALMEAKAQGRDRLVIADPPAPGGIVPGPPVPAGDPA